jgi:hypothetical protein
VVAISERAFATFVHYDLAERGSSRRGRERRGEAGYKRVQGAAAVEPNSEMGVVADLGPGCEL